MVRSRIVTTTRPWLSASAAVVLVMMALVGRPDAQVQNAAPTPVTEDAKRLASLLDRAAATAPGTYLVTDGPLEPARDGIAIVVQADAVRGDRSIRVPIVLGAELSQASVVGVRIVMLGAGAERPSVVGDAAGTGPAGRLRFIREFTLAPGTYEIHAAVGNPGTTGGLTATLVKTQLIVPDIWRESLAVSPVILGDAVAPVAPATTVQPFTFGPTALSPATSIRYGQAERLHAAFRVYNWSGQAGAKPDLTVEYVFYQQTSKRLTFFNKMKPQHLRDGTLSGTFDSAASVVTAGVSVPLVSFPFGDFQMAVRVTDNRTKQTAERQVRFVVAP